ncbi:MAG: efflux transporter outer membrane subunit, partial [Proteobacteria bacterium]|nr:efflux transporter outer membrane subunit [Pseudomonadota bacterium]
NTLKKQLELGGIAKTDVLAQAATLANVQATLPVLEKQLAQIRHQLSVLAGNFPAQAPQDEFRLDGLKLPEELPLSLPSKLIEQRPDIKAAEAELHAASAEIGVATANMLPQISLTAGYGANAGNIPDLFSPGSIVWNLGANLLQPVFRGGELRHKRNAAEAEFDRAAAQYRGTVLTAFQNVADALRALQSDAEALKSQLAAERAARDSLDLARSQFKEGAISHLALLNAEQAFQQSKIARVQAQARRYADTAALFQALGGGWWNRENFAETQTVTITENNKGQSKE